MRQVSLLGPDTMVAPEIRRAYTPLVTDRLLATWLSQPDSAPGREVSNPWPARIVVDSVVTEADGCIVFGAIEYVTTQDTARAVSRSSLRLQVKEQNGWRVSAYEKVVAVDTTDARETLRAYYDAINAHDYTIAYELWENGGQASGLTLAGFAGGFSKTSRVRLTVTDSVRIEGAAGSQYATIPVELDAVLENGDTQRFVGSYTLRRSMVDGATPDQRRWHIYKAKLTQVTR